MEMKLKENGLFYLVLGFASCVAFIYMSFGDLLFKYSKEPEMNFVRKSGIHFILNGKAFYINGWNSYWLMDQAVEDYSRPRVSAMLQAGAKMGLTVCRTWAFNDGGYNALQISPGHFDERVFKGLDYVIAEARKHGIKLILTLVNNLQHFGGKSQYVKWAWGQGYGLSSSNDSFFFDPSIVNHFKTYVKELQDWVDEMATFVKSIDQNHLLTVGLEGFYGPSSPEKMSMNPGDWASSLGSDFIRNSKISNIDFASVHIYVDQWILENEFEDKLKFVKRWMISHINDGDRILKKPVLFTEFGLSNNNKNFKPSHRESYYKIILDIIYESARRKGAGAGALAWQFMVEGMEEYSDEFGIVPWEISSIYKLITEQSRMLNTLT
ncbi:mannan endo-1,4-beta-mannosidase [Ranunculus cassubicifolius]